MSFGIALSGGGAKGAAHIGVLKALEENNLFPTSVSGTSIGAIDEAQISDKLSEPARETTISDDFKTEIISSK